jgi:hypothetical protein
VRPPVSHLGRPFAPALFALLAAALACDAQSLAVLQGHVFDPSGAVVPGAAVILRAAATGSRHSARSSADGRFHLTGIPPGTYRIDVEATGFRTIVVEGLALAVGRTIVRDFHLELGTTVETITVTGDAQPIDRASATVDHVLNARTIREIPLNGRYFADLGTLVPGSVAPSQAGFSARPSRGQGPLAFNTAGNREEAVAFLVNGVSSNNLTFGSLIFQPPLAAIQEFSIANSAFGAEYGHVSGAIVDIVTRSGTNDFQGELSAFVRNDALDARNFFEFTSSDPHPFRRQQFGGALGGPVSRGQTFFFATYEGLRQWQGLDMNSLVLSDAERAEVTSPVVQRLVELIPRANYVDDAGVSRFVGWAPAVVQTNRWTADFTHSVGPDDRLHAFFGGQRSLRVEPASQGNSVPGFGSRQQPSSSLVTVTATQVAGSVLNEVRFGRSRLNGGTFPNTSLNPAEFGINNGVTRAIGLPQMIVAGGLNFGGPGNLPTGRFDTSYVFSDTVTRAAGRHFLRFGGEYRHFINENFAEGTGVFNFPSVDAFLDGIANSFSIVLGERRSIIDHRAFSLFLQDRIAVDRLSIELGMRYEWHLTPTERRDRFVVFDPATVALLRVGVDVESIYAQNRNIEPRLGAAWSFTADGRTVLRAAYARSVDQPGTTAVRDTAGNPPFGEPLRAVGSISLSAAVAAAGPALLSPSSVDPRFRNASLDAWNVNLQRQVSTHMAVTVGYIGSRGQNLRMTRDINQPLDGVRPFPALSATSPILAGAQLGNIMQVESSGFSSYAAGWISVTQRRSDGLQFDASYTWSKSLDTNSLNSSGFAIQNGYDIAAEYGLSDFDARHRFVGHAIYRLPFTGSALTRGWQVAVVVQGQSGNPVNIVTANSGLNGLPNTVRPDINGPIRIIGSVDQWFDTSVFAAVDRFGALGRNVVIGPAFYNTDLSVSRDLLIARMTLQVRVDVFDLFNRPNLGQPGNVVGSPTFGRVSSTRLPTGEAGSSRQIQLGARLSF